ncbi:glycosyl hydrolase family 3 [Colletotrichum salicis]|uniref:beta-glucosidase n=1 Tax=Colletotrichum salicis TaxID=1209931 RepID=A0A135V7L8_9PEZI|nr:glycosyl hydrolase family 3 [Colletotrichum salicis]
MTPLARAGNVSSVPLSDLFIPVANATIRVTNTGDRSGATVVQLYMSLLTDSAPSGTPIKVLRSFSKVELGPGETRQVAFGLNRRDFSYWDTDIQTWRVPAGQFQLDQVSTRFLAHQGNLLLKRDQSTFALNVRCWTGPDRDYGVSFSQQYQQQQPGGAKGSMFAIVGSRNPAKLVFKREEEAISAKYGCKPVQATLPYKWPFALDLLKHQYDSLPSGRLLEFQTRYMNIAPTLRIDILGEGYIITDPVNIETILSTRFEDFGLGSRRLGRACSSLCIVFICSCRILQALWPTLATMGGYLSKAPYSYQNCGVVTDAANVLDFQYDDPVNNGPTMCQNTCNATSRTASLLLDTKCYCSKDGITKIEFAADPPPNGALCTIRCRETEPLPNGLGSLPLNCGGYYNGAPCIANLYDVFYILPDCHNNLSGVVWHDFHVCKLFNFFHSNIFNLLIHIINNLRFFFLNGIFNVGSFFLGIIFNLLLDVVVIIILRFLFLDIIFNLPIHVIAILGSFFLGIIFKHPFYVIVILGLSFLNTIFNLLIHVIILRFSILDIVFKLLLHVIFKPFYAIFLSEF